MAVTNITRNLRDGQIIIKDGAGTPTSITLALDNGDLSWTVALNTIQVLDRGTLDHTRPGDDATSDLSYSAMLTQLADATTGNGSVYQFYEMVTDGGATLTSTSGSGEQFTLKHEFEITDPQGSNNERVTFDRVYMTDVSVSEGDDADTVSFSGVNFRTKPDVTRY